jgi:16S rRNA (guanine527-N7)-methyltransferase
MAPKRPRDASPAAVDRLLGRQDWKRVEDLLRATAVDPGATLPPLRDFCRRVITWNRTVSNLVSKNDESRIVERHLIESLEHASWLLEAGATRWLDFGSGAGFPAIPLSIAGVGERWTLVESRRIKSLFLRKALQEIGIESGKTVINARLEALVDGPDRFDGFTARAAGRLPETLAMASRLLLPGATAFLWKGSRWSSEIEDQTWKNEWEFHGSRPLTNSTVVLLKFVRSGG